MGIKFEAANKQIPFQTKQKLFHVRTSNFEAEEVIWSVRQPQTGKACGKISRNAENRRKATKGEKKCFLLLSALILGFNLLSNVQTANHGCSVLYSASSFTLSKTAGPLQSVADGI